MPTWQRVRPPPYRAEQSPPVLQHSCRPVAPGYLRPLATPLSGSPSGWRCCRLHRSASSWTRCAARLSWRGALLRDGVRSENNERHRCCSCYVTAHLHGFLLKQRGSGRRQICSPFRASRVLMGVHFSGNSSQILCRSHTHELRGSSWGPPARRQSPPGEFPRNPLFFWSNCYVRCRPWPLKRKGASVGAARARSARSLSIAYSGRSIQSSISAPVSSGRSAGKQRQAQ